MEAFKKIMVGSHEMFNEIVLERKTFVITYEEPLYNSSFKELPDIIPERIKERLVLKLAENIYSELKESIDYAPATMAFRYSLVLPVYLSKDNEEVYKSTIKNLQRGIEETEIACKSFSKDYYELKKDNEALENSLEYFEENYYKTLKVFKNFKEELQEEKEEAGLVLDRMSFKDRLVLVFRLLFNLKKFKETVEDM